MRQLVCEGGCKGKKADTGQGKWMCKSCQKKNGVFKGSLRSQTEGKVVRLPGEVAVRAGDRRQSAFFVCAASFITQSVVAGEAGIAQSYVNQVFNGNISPPAHLKAVVIRLLAEAGYAYTEDELFYWGLPDVEGK